jgi:DNA-directed RNA polymerase subunit RPC12/RpoP
MITTPTLCRCGRKFFPGPGTFRNQCKRCRPRKHSFKQMKADDKAAHPEPYRPPLIREYNAEENLEYVVAEPAKKRGYKMCSDLTRRVYVCERCDRNTYAPLQPHGEELVCAKCVKRPPDPTPAEIYRMAAELRLERDANWESRED